MPKETDVIHADAPAAQPAVATPVVPVDINDPLAHYSRAEAMAAVSARRRETAAADMDPDTAKAFLENATTPVDPDADPEADAAEAERKRLEAAAETAAPDTEIDPDAQLEAQQSEDLILSDEDLSKYKVRVKINGKEELRPLTEVRAAAQKTESADQYLVQAKDLLREVKEMQRAGAQPASSASTEELPAPTSDGPDPSDAIVDAMFQGDEATAKKLMKQVLRGQTQPAPAEQVARQVEQRIVIRSALRQFAKDHKDISADPTLRRVADTFLLEETGGLALDQLEPDRVPEVLEAAGRRTKEWIRSVAGVPSTQARATTRDEKRALKAGIDELPTAATRASTTVPQPLTPQDVIARMKAARGQLHPG